MRALRLLQEVVSSVSAVPVWVDAGTQFLWKEQITGNKRNVGRADTKWVYNYMKRRGRPTIDDIWLDLTVWGRDGKQNPALKQVFTVDGSGMRAAKKYAMELIRQGDANMVSIRSKARMNYASKGYSEQSIEEFGYFEREER